MRGSSKSSPDELVALMLSFNNDPEEPRRRRAAARVEVAVGLAEELARRRGAFRRFPADFPGAPRVSGGGGQDGTRLGD